MWIKIFKLRRGSKYLFLTICSKIYRLKQTCDLNFFCIIVWVYDREEEIEVEIYKLKWIKWRLKYC